MAVRDDVLDEIAGRLAMRVSEPVLRVGIDGIDAAGKTTFADELAIRLRALGRPVIRSGIDHFHNPREIRYAKGSDSPAGFYQDSHNLDCLAEMLLRPLGRGGSGRYRTALFDHRRNAAVEAPEMRAEPDAILLFDGIFVLRPQLRAYWDYTIFVKVGFDVALARSLCVICRQGAIRPNSYGVTESAICRLSSAISPNAAPSRMPTWSSTITIHRTRLSRSCANEGGRLALPSHELVTLPRLQPRTSRRVAHA